MSRRIRRPVAGTSEDEARRASTHPAVETGEANHRRDPALEGARLHRDEQAAELTDALGAKAVTVGRNVYLSPDAPELASTGGRRLLAHELTHIVQQRQFGERVQRFEASERPKIAPNLAALMGVVHAIVIASSHGGDVNMDEFVLRAGGHTASGVLPKALRSADPPGMSMLTLRYLFTRRCGLIDLRHFAQLLYMSWFMNMGNSGMAARGATARGVDYERTHEVTSKFAPEDLTSNALGAWTATRLPGLPQHDNLVARIRETFERCAPVDFDALSATSQAAVVSFYSARSGTGEPLNQNTTAVALIPAIPEVAGTDRSFPFELDENDPNRATIAGPAFDSGAVGLRSDSDIRSFVAVQRDEVIRELPFAEKMRLGARLLQGWVSDEDIDAFARIYRLSDIPTRSGMRAVAAAVTLSAGQDARLRTVLSTP